jgi:hypothetical protein
MSTAAAVKHCRTKKRRPELDRARILDSTAVDRASRKRMSTTVSWMKNWSGFLPPGVTELLSKTLTPGQTRLMFFGLEHRDGFEVESDEQLGERINLKAREVRDAVALLVELEVVEKTPRRGGGYRLKVNREKLGNLRVAPARTCRPKDRPAPPAAGAAADNADGHFAQLRINAEEPVPARVECPRCGEVSSVTLHTAADGVLTNTPYNKDAPDEGETKAKENKQVPENQPLEIQFGTGVPNSISPSPELVEQNDRLQELQRLLRVEAKIPVPSDDYLIREIIQPVGPAFGVLLDIVRIPRNLTNLHFAPKGAAYLKGFLDSAKHNYNLRCKQEKEELERARAAGEKEARRLQDEYQRGQDRALADFRAGRIKDREVLELYAEHYPAIADELLAQPCHDDEQEPPG